MIDARQGSVLHLDFRLCGPKAKSEYFEQVAEAAADHFRVVVSLDVICSRGLVVWRGRRRWVSTRGRWDWWGADASSFAIVIVISCILCRRCRRGLTPGVLPSGEGPFGGPGWERGLAVKSTMDELFPITLM